MLTGHLRLLYIDFQSVFDHHDFTHSKLKHHLASYYLNAAFDMLIDTVYVIDQLITHHYLIYLAINTCETIALHILLAFYMFSFMFVLYNTVNIYLFFCFVFLDESHFHFLINVKSLRCSTASLHMNTL